MFNSSLIFSQKFWEHLCTFHSHDLCEIYRWAWKNYPATTFPYSKSTIRTPRQHHSQNLWGFYYQLWTDFRHCSSDSIADWVNVGDFINQLISKLCVIFLKFCYTSFSLPLKLRKIFPVLSCTSNIAFR